jgi:hypothetical protein
LRAERLRVRCRALLAEIATADRLDLALRLTLLCLLLRPIGYGWERPAFMMAATAGLLLRRVRRHPGFWIFVTLVATVRVLRLWPLADNHAYLLVYWCLAAALALWTASPSASLARNARLLVGLTFLFATVWKVGLSPDYMDGRFFRVTLLTDERFADFSRVVGGLSQDQYDELSAFVTAHVDESLPPGIEPPVEPERFRRLALFLTHGTWLLEGAVGLTFLWPRRDRVSWLRDPMLLLFCSTVYAVATVEGFAYELLAMGVAQCDPRQRAMRVLYLVAYLAVVVHKMMPWHAIAARALGV